MDTDQVILEKPIGSIDRLFCIFLYGYEYNAKYALKCINKRLSKMNEDLRFDICEKLKNIHLVNLYNNLIPSRKYYFKNGALTIK